MFNNTQIRLVKLRNEAKAQKQASKMRWGQLSTPETAPTTNWSGAINVAAPLSRSTICKFDITFTRTDGRTEAPLVDFAYDFTTNPSWATMDRDKGATITIGSEKSLIETYSEPEVTTESGAGYVKATISFPESLWTGLSTEAPIVFGVSSVNLTINAAAYSPVPGTLTITRSYNV